MRYEGFDVYNNNGEILETLPAILYREDTKIIAQVPAGQSTAKFVEVETGTVLGTLTVENGRAVLEYEKADALYTIRVGDGTKTRMNQVTIDNRKPVKPVDQQEEKLKKLEAANESLNLQLIELWETLIGAGVI